MITAGIDVGAETVKAVILVDQELVGWSMVKAELDRRVSAEKALQSAEAMSGLPAGSIQKIMVTGSGRKTIAMADGNVSDIIATGRGVFFLFPSVKTVIDIGAEEARAIRVDAGGDIRNFAKNDKCAAGVGAFLGAMARALELNIEDLGVASQRSRQHIPINATCVVFAESEVVSLIHSQIPKEDIARAIHESVAIRITSMARRIGIERDIVFIGGVVRNVGVIESLNRHLGMDMLIPERPEIVTAIGAAIIAREEME
jgi:benzoyl-CoA reductase subunit D